MRETNTVLLSLETYNELKKAHDTINKHEFYVFSLDRGLYYSIKKDKFIEKMEDKIISLQEANLKLKREIDVKPKFTVKDLKSIFDKTLKRNKFWF